MAKHYGDSLLELDVDTGIDEKDQYLVLVSVTPHIFVNFLVFDEDGRQVSRMSLRAWELAKLRNYLNSLELPDVPSWEGNVPETLDDVLDIAYDVPQERSSDFLDFLREYAANRR